MSKLCIGLPCYHWVSTTFCVRLAQVVSEFEQTPIIATDGVFLQGAMADIMRRSLDYDWERILIIEQDMVFPYDTLHRHAAHTEPIVGSVYFQHLPPHNPEIYVEHSNGEYGAPHPQRVANMIQQPGLYPVHAVGFGLTSIRRDVIENWTDGVVMFKTQDERRIGNGHDTRFCEEAAKQGHRTYVDTSIVCEHLTEIGVDARHYLHANSQEIRGF